ncbi:hypothetical protein MSG28_000548 [Choristoneura fumiferana]|uniref:Uncharacterized protein n=1 Tax=Choristoneura fumiferana TaxID=7141 RepID=A0ACC0K1X3_CHOFU|nr:hypothetical protein MSG28_000548 [Choristoneura fumiferana]
MAVAYANQRLRLPCQVHPAPRIIQTPSILYFEIRREVCGGSCCGRGREARLAAALQRAAAARAAAATRPVAALLLSTHNTLQGATSLPHFPTLLHTSNTRLLAACY